MKTLTYQQPVRLAAWADDAFVTVFTTRGYALANGRDADEAEARARRNGHALMGTIYSSNPLVGDRTLGAALLAKARAQAAAAVTLDRDEVVKIEGRPYRVRIARGNDGRYPVNCDPIHFIPVPAVDLEGIDDALRDDADRKAMEAQCFPNSGRG